MKANNVVEMLERTVKKFPDKKAFMWKNEDVLDSLTYGDFWNRIENFANGLLHLGIKADDKIAIISNSNPMWGVSDFSIASIQAVSVPIYPTIPPEQVEYIVNNINIKYAIVENVEQYDKLQAAGVDLDKIIMMFSDSSANREYINFSEVERLGSENKTPDWAEMWQHIDRDQLLTIMNTSGTTGNPKGVMLTHGNILTNIEGVQFWVIELVPEDVALSYLPLSHIFERLAGHYLPLSIGVSIGYASSIETIPDDLQEIKPTVLTSVPRLFEKVYTQVIDQMNNSSKLKQKIFNWALSIGEQKYDYYIDAKFDNYFAQDFLPKGLFRKWKLADKLVFQKIKDKLGGNLRGVVSGGGTLNPEIAKFFWSLDIPLLEGYGLTETSPIISSNPMVRSKVGTVGRVLPNLEVKIAEDGEILVKGPSITQGYYNDPEETAESFVGEWFKTGDIGDFDEDGYLKILDRKKRLLVLSTGMNVAPAPIESAMNESVYIGQSIVVGDNEKYVITLINPEFETLIPWARKKGITTDDKKELCDDPVVQKLLNKEVSRLTSKFTNYAQPKKVIVISDVWSVDTGEVTPKLSLRTNIIEDTYKNLIHSAYEDEKQALNEKVV